MAGERVMKRQRSPSTGGTFSGKRWGKLSPPEGDEKGSPKSIVEAPRCPPWPEDFIVLMRIFQSLNTVFTFCCTRKHFPTTFENLKTSVENLAGR